MRSLIQNLRSDELNEAVDVMVSAFGRIITSKTLWQIIGKVAFGIIGLIVVVLTTSGRAIGALVRR